MNIDTQNIVNGKVNKRGKVYIGAIGTDPTNSDNAITIYTDYLLTKPINGWGIDLNFNGLPLVDGKQVNLYSEGSYSFQAKDKDNADIFREWIDFVDTGSSDFDISQFRTLQNAIDSGLSSGSYCEIYERALGSGIGGASYEVTDVVQPALGTVNHLMTNGNYLKLLIEEPVKVSQCGAIPDDNSQDITLILSGMADAGINGADLEGFNLYQLTGGSLGVSLYTSVERAFINCLNNVSYTVDMEGFVIGDGITVDFGGGMIENWITIVDGSNRLKVGDIKFQNSFSTTFTNFILFHAYGISDFLFDGCSADNVDVQKSGTPGDDDGSMRLIIMSGGTNTNPLSKGTIRNLTCDNFGNDEDSDLVQIFNLTEVNPYDVNIHDIRTNNVGKRAVKVQANGCNVYNITSFNDRVETQFVVVGHLGNQGNITNVKGYGNINYSLELFDSCSARNISLESTAAVSDAVVTCAGGSPVLSEIYGKGTTKGALLARPTISDIELLTISDIDGQYTQELILCGMDPSNPARQFNHLVISDIRGTTNITNQTIIACSSSGGVNIDRVDIQGYSADFSSTPHITAISIEADAVYISDFINTTATGSVVNLIGASEVAVRDAKTTSGTRCVNLDTCSNTSMVNCEGGSSEVIRIDGGNSHIMNGNITTIGGASNAQANAPTNVQDVNPIVRT